MITFTKRVHNRVSRGFKELCICSLIIAFKKDFHNDLLLLLFATAMSVVKSVKVPVVEVA